MAVIRLRERRALAPARRINLGLGGLVVLQRALAGVDGARLPSDFEVEPTVLALAGPDLERLIEETAQTLRVHGVIDDDGPVDAVLANVAAVTGSPYRVRVSLSGLGSSVVAHYWTSAEVAGSLVRDGAHCTLSLFDARAFGSEILTLLPEPEHPADGREIFSAPLEALAVLSALDELAQEQVEPMGSLLEVDPGLARALRSWSESVLAVLHVTVYDVDPARLPGMAVWFLDRAGWWSARTWRDGETRMVEIEPRDRSDAAAHVGVLTSRAWR